MFSPLDPAGLNDFRAIKGAVSLKPTAVHQPRSISVYFRAIKGAVSLKRDDSGWRSLSEPDFRAIKGAVSLKQRKKILRSPRRH